LRRGRGSHDSSAAKIPIAVATSSSS